VKALRPGARLPHRARSLRRVASHASVSTPHGNGGIPARQTLMPQVQADRLIILGGSESVRVQESSGRVPCGTPPPWRALGLFGAAGAARAQPQRQSHDRRAGRARRRPSAPNACRRICRAARCHSFDHFESAPYPALGHEHPLIPTGALTLAQRTMPPAIVIPTFPSPMRQPTSALSKVAMTSSSSCQARFRKS
jgi:hypothetical protein